MSFDHSREVVAFSFGLLGHHGFALVELLLPSVFKFSGNLHGFLSCQLLLATLLALAFFESTLGTQCIDLGLAVGSFFLHLAESSNLAFLFFGDLAVFFSLGSFTGGLFLVITDNSNFFLLFLLLLLLLLAKSDTIGRLNFGNQAGVAFAFDFGLLDFIFLHRLDLAAQLLLFFRQELPLPDALPLAFLNLVDDYGCALALGLLADNLALLSNLKSLEAFNLHHDVKALLLLNPLALEMLVFL